jgi:hypothetical protein
MGIEPTTKTPENPTLPHQGGAESGALAPEKPAIDPALASIIDAWAKLPDAMKAGILAMIRTASG